MAKPVNQLGVIGRALAQGQITAQERDRLVALRKDDPTAFQTAVSKLPQSAISQPVPVPANIAPATQRDFTKEQQKISKLGFSPIQAAQLQSNPQYLKLLFESAYTPQQLKNLPDYQNVLAAEQQVQTLGQQATGQAPAIAPDGTPLPAGQPSQAKLSILEGALRDKLRIGQQELGQSKGFEQAGIAQTGTLGFAVLNQSLGQRAQEINDRFTRFQDKMLASAQTMSSVHQDVANRYVLAKDEFNRNVEQFNGVLSQIEQHDRSMNLLEEESRINREAQEMQNQFVLQRDNQQQEFEARRLQAELGASIAQIRERGKVDVETALRLQQISPDKIVEVNGESFFLTHEGDLLPVEGKIQRPEIPSTPTSDTGGMQIIDTKNPLGANCVKYARQSVPNLPFGLWTKEDKQKAVRSTGNRDMSQIQIGDAILTDEGQWGHVAVVTGVENGQLVLREANYKSGLVTEGRKINQNDASIYGFISPNNPNAQFSSVIGNQESAVNEGTNQSIDKQMLQTGQAEQISLDQKLMVERLVRRSGTEAERNENRNLIKELIQQGISDEGDLALKVFGAKLTPTQQDAAVKIMQKLNQNETYKKFQDIKASVTRIGTGVKLDNAQGDLMLINAFQRMLDPGVSVRVEEFKVVDESQGLVQRLSVLPKRMLDGDRMRPEIRERFLKAVKELYKNEKENFEEFTIPSFSENAEQFGIPLNTLNLTSPNFDELYTVGKQTKDESGQFEAEYVGDKTKERVREYLTEQGYDNPTEDEVNFVFNQL